MLVRSVSCGKDVKKYFSQPSLFRIGVDRNSSKFVQAKNATFFDGGFVDLFICDLLIGLAGSWIRNVLMFFSLLFDRQGPK